MNELEIWGDYTGRKRTNADGASPEDLTFFLDDEYLVKLRTLRNDANLGVQEIFPKVRTVKAMVGATMDPPTGGTFTLSRGGLTEPQFEETAAINFDATADQFMTAWNALGPLYENALEVVLAAPCTWLVRLDAAGQVPVQVSTNKLAPQAFVRVRPYQEGDVWWHEVRLIKAAIAFTSGEDRVLPLPPKITRIRTGSARVPGDSSNTNEVQSLFFPLDFTGSYFLRFDYRTTQIFGLGDDATVVATALNAMYVDGQTRFRVSNPEAGSLYIEFVGPLAESPQTLIEVVVQTSNPGPLTFKLDFKKSTAAAALRAVPSVEVPFEIELTVVDDNQDPSDLTIPGRTFTLFQDEKVTVKREGIWAELDVNTEHDWSRPPQPKRYTKVTSDQIIVGHQHFEMAFGDPSTLQYLFDHDLHTQAALLGVRTNASPSRMLGQGTEYAVEQTDDSVTINVTDFPETDGLVLVFLAIPAVPVYQAHTHTIDDVDGLRAILDAHSSQLGEVLDRLGYTVNTADTGTTLDISIAIPSRYEAFPGKFAKAQSSGSIEQPTRTGALLPAIHRASVIDHDFSASIPTLVDGKGKVYKHTGTGQAILQGGKGHSSPVLQTNDLVGCDGRLWYRVTRDDATKNSFYPTDMERTLFVVPINEDMLTPGHSLELQLKLAILMLASQVTCQYVFTIDVGTISREDSPTPTDDNVKADIWNSHPIMQRTLALSDLLVDGGFGANIRRAIDNTFTALGRRYNATSSSPDGVPAAPNFLLRGRLHKFDVVDDVPDPKGSVYFALTEASVHIS